MTDIVERLRGTPLWRHSTPPSRDLEESDLGLEAADEIERLRKGIKDAITDIIEDDAKSPNILGKLKALIGMAALDEQVAQ